MLIEPAGPFRFEPTARSHGWVMLAPNEWDPEKVAMRRVHRLESGKVVLLEIEEGPKAGIAVRVSHRGRLPAASRRQIADAVAHMFRLDEDLSGFYELCRDRGGRWGRVPEGFGRLLRSPTAFEDVVKTILTTNVQWGGTVRMVRELVEAYGDPYHGPSGDRSEDPYGERSGIPRRAFPTPAAIAADSPETFAEAVGLGYRAPYVHELARRVASGDLELEELWRSNLSTPELQKALRGIKGVGPYAAATLSMLAGRYDALPQDSVFRDFVARAYFEGEAPPSDADARAVYEPWGRWKYLAYWFELWTHYREQEAR